jgi:hypothetical protein
MVLNHVAVHHRCGTLPLSRGHLDSNPWRILRRLDKRRHAISPQSEFCIGVWEMRDNMISTR